MIRKRSDLGQGMLEYSLIVALLAIVSMYAMVNVGSIMKVIHSKVAQGADDAKNFAQSSVSGSNTTSAP